jgi:tetratricopeptide (TPR) repeat protein
VQRELGCCEHCCQVRTSFNAKTLCLFSYSDALRLNPNSPDALALRGLVLFLTGRLPAALQHVTSALRLDPGHEPAQKLRKRIKDVERLKEEGNVAFKTGKLQEAYEKYSECLEVCLHVYLSIRIRLFIGVLHSALVRWKKRAKVAKSEPHCCPTARRPY